MDARFREFRHARSADVEALAELKRTTFRETFLDGFGIPYPPTDLAAFEDECYGVAKIAAELADPTHMTWVMGDGLTGALVAYAHVGPCKLPHPEASTADLELYQFYVRAEVQGSGIGRRLLDLVLGSERARNGSCWLGVWSGNTKAQTIYGARGFAPVGTYKFRVGTWFDEEIIMRRDRPRA